MIDDETELGGQYSGIATFFQTLPAHVDNVLFKFDEFLVGLRQLAKRHDLDGLPAERGDGAVTAASMRVRAAWKRPL